MNFDKNRSVYDWRSLLKEIDYAELRDARSAYREVLRSKTSSEANYKFKHRRSNENCDVCMYVCYHKSLWRCLRELKIAESSGLRHFVGNCVLQKSYISDFEKFKVRSH